MLPLNVSISDISTNSSFGPNLEAHSGNNSDNSTFSTMFSRDSHHVFNETHISPERVHMMT